MKFFDIHHHILESFTRNIITFRRIIITLIINSSDPRMGVLEPGFICPTDGMLNYMETPGYFGHIELARPVFYIQYFTQIIKILTMCMF